jgi:hypothetical protein
MPRTVSGPPGLYCQRDASIAGTYQRVRAMFAGKRAHPYPGKPRMCPNPQPPALPGRFTRPLTQNAEADLEVSLERAVPAGSCPDVGNQLAFEYRDVVFQQELAPLQARKLKLILDGIL